MPRQSVIAIGDRIRSLRITKSLTQEDLADLARCGKRSIERMEKSERVDLPTLRSVAHALDALIEELYVIESPIAKRALARDTIAAIVVLRRIFETLVMYASSFRHELICESLRNGSLASLAFSAESICRDVQELLRVKLSLLEPVEIELPLIESLFDALRMFEQQVAVPLRQASTEDERKRALLKEAILVTERIIEHAKVGAERCSVLVQ